MRLHRLEITAFGPFAETVEVDFDHPPTPVSSCSPAPPVRARRASSTPSASPCTATSRATGSAKRPAPTRPPGRPDRACGARGDAGGPPVPRRAVPAWSRPKKRGDGTTTEQASVSIAERVDGSWTTLSTRLDETGHLVTRLVGMNVGQFTQVAAAARTLPGVPACPLEERHLLQQLFRTGRFDAVEVAA